MKNIMAMVVGGAVAILSGCATAPTVESSSDGELKGGLTTMGKIDVKDFQNMADNLVDDLLASGNLERLPNQPAVLVVDRIINNTQMQMDTDSLVKRIRTRLLNSGKVVVNTTYGNRSESKLAEEHSQMQGFMNDEPAKMERADVFLTGKIIEDRSKQGSKREVVYDFQLTMTSAADGMALWEGQKFIRKEGKKAPLGF